VNPSLIYVSLSAYGHQGPWARKRGFDSLVQTASGFNAAEGEAAGTDKPRALPFQVLDHATGHLLAFATMTALRRRATTGGRWEVKLSLAQTATWLRSLGRIDGLGTPDLGLDDVRDRMEDSASGFGRLSAVRYSAEMSETPPHYARPAVRLGTDKPEWPA
jgi:crotonobetainyl-CoA:carnitine CoA-transferase CaiB-like acyl-CoA transferase